MTMTFFDRDRQRVEALLGEPSYVKVLGTQCDRSRVLEGTFDEVNYAATEDRRQLAQSGVRFVGWHGQGGDYPAFRFYSTGSGLYEHECTNDGQLLVRVRESGEPHKEALAAVRRFRNGERRIQRYLAIHKSPRETPA